MLRRLYVPLLSILAVVIVVGLLDQGSGHSTKQPAAASSGARSVFPKPSTVPTTAQPAPVAPAVTTPPAATTTATTAHKPAPPKHATRHAGHAKAQHKQRT
jgi:hypothetical protein